jgi:hypothetical protein
MELVQNSVIVEVSVLVAFKFAFCYLSWLRHCATSRKVVGSSTMALGLTQPLTEISTRNISWGIKAADA